jgi:hypothetical protein
VCSALFISCYRQVNSAVDASEEVNVRSQAHVVLISLGASL